MEARYGWHRLPARSKIRRTKLNHLLNLFETEISNGLPLYPEYTVETEAFRVALLGFRMELNPAKPQSLDLRRLNSLKKAESPQGSTSPQYG